MSPKCVACELQPYGRHCDYHSGYEDGYEAAQREREEGSPNHVPKALKEFAARGYERQLPHFESGEPQGRPGS